MVWEGEDCHLTAVRLRTITKCRLSVQCYVNRLYIAQSVRPDQGHILTAPCSPISFSYIHCSLVSAVLLAHPCGRGTPGLLPCLVTYQVWTKHPIEAPAGNLCCIAPFTLGRSLCVLSLRLFIQYSYTTCRRRICTVLFSTSGFRYRLVNKLINIAHCTAP